MAIKDLKREIKIKAMIASVYSNEGNIDSRIYNYLEILEREGGKYTIKILDLISTIDTKGYEELTYQLALNSIKNMPVVEPVKVVDVKESASSVKELLEKIKKERGKKK